MVISMVAIFSLTGCKTTTTTETTAAATTAAATTAAETTAAETTVVESGAVPEDVWLGALKGKWAGQQVDIVTTTFLTAPNLDKKFEELTGCKVNVHTVAWADLMPKLTTTLAAKSAEGMDVFITAETMTGQFGENGWYVPMQDIFTKEEWNDRIPSYTDMYTYPGNGDLISFPCLAMPYLLFYNDTLLKKGGYDGPPKNWDELRSISMDLVKKGIVKYATTWPLFSGDDMSSETWACILTAMGGQWWTADGKPAFNSDIGLKSMNYLTDSIYKDKWASPTSVEVEKTEGIQPFLKGENAFNLTWQFMWPMTQDPKQSTVSKDAKFAMVPFDQGAKASSWISGGDFQVNPYSSKIELARDYARFMGCKANALDSFKERGWLPMWKSFYSNPEVIKIEPNLQILLDALSFTAMRPIDPWYAESNEIQRTELSRAWSGEISNKEALDNAEKALLQRISENWK